MDTALSIVAVHGAAIFVSLHERMKLAQVGAELVGRHGGIFPALPSMRLAGDKDGCAQSRFAHEPDALRLVRRILADGRSGRERLRGCREFAGLAVSILGRP